MLRSMQTTVLRVIHQQEIVIWRSPQTSAFVPMLVV